MLQLAWIPSDSLHVSADTCTDLLGFGSVEVHSSISF